MFGPAAGGALVTTVELRPPGSFEPASDIVRGGPFYVQVGAQADQVSMALAWARACWKASVRIG